MSHLANVKDYLEELSAIQAQLNMVLSANPTSCPVDARYLAEWQKIARAVDIAVSTLRLSLEADAINEELLLRWEQWLDSLLPVMAGMFNGHITDLAHCQECAVFSTCTMRAKARTAFEEMLPPEDPL